MVIGRAAPLRVENNAVYCRRHRVASHVFLLRNGCHCHKAIKNLHDSIKNLLDSCGMLLYREQISYRLHNTAAIQTAVLHGSSVVVASDRHHSAIL